MFTRVEGLTTLGFTRHRELARSIEGEFNLSKYITEIVADGDAYKALSELLIAVESAFIEATMLRNGKKEITEEAIEDEEKDTGKWLG